MDQEVNCWTTQSDSTHTQSFNMVTVPHKMAGSESMLDYRGFTACSIHIKPSSFPTFSSAQKDAALLLSAFLSPSSVHDFHFAVVQQWYLCVAKECILIVTVIH